MNRKGLEPALEGGLATFDRTSAERVLDGYAGWSERCEVRLFELAGVAAVNGTVQSGGACADAEGEPLPAACAPGTTCDTAASTPSCVALPREGMSCSGAGPCATGLACRDERCKSPRRSANRVETTSTAPRFTVRTTPVNIPQLRGQNTTLQSFGPGGNRSWNQTASSASILLVGFPALNAAEYTARNASIFIARGGRLQRLR
jgi:hypothetical protein